MKKAVFSLKNVFPCFAIVFLILSYLGGHQANSLTIAAEVSQQLVVPYSDVAIQAAIPVPKGMQAKPECDWWLVSVDSADATLPAQFIPAIAADGSVDENLKQLAISVPPATTNGDRRFLPRAIAKQDAARGSSFDFTEIGGKSLKLSDGDKPVFAYNYGLITSDNIPQNDSRRNRGSYVHPVWGIEGEVLTDDFPKDHYHHHGIFWAWPHVTSGGEHHDLWSQAVGGAAGQKSDIHQKFVRWLHRGEGPVAAVLGVENGWFVRGKKVMIERVWLRAFKVSDRARSLDMEFFWIPVDAPLALRCSDGAYGGVSIRFAVRSPDDAVITIPSCCQKEDVGHVKLPWADLTYPFADNGRPSGAALFVDPAHPDFPPEWLLRHYGSLCIGWPGQTDRIFPANQPIRLGYRLWIHKDSVGVDYLQKIHQAYAAATGLRWE